MGLLLLRILPLLLVIFPNLLSAQTVTFAVGEWAPYTGAALPGQGPAVELVKAAAAAGGLTPLFEWVPWKRAEIRVENASVFASFPYLELKERQGRFLFSEPLLTLQFVVVTRKTDTRLEGKVLLPVVFQGLRVGYAAGTEAIPEALTPTGALLEDTPSLEQSLLKLLAGRLDAVIEDRYVMRDALVRTGRATDLRVLGQFGSTQDLKVMVGASYPQAEALLGRFNEGLARIRANGLYDRLVRLLGP